MLCILKISINSILQLATFPRTVIALRRKLICILAEWLHKFWFSWEICRTSRALMNHRVSFLNECCELKFYCTEIGGTSFTSFMFSARVGRVAMGDQWISRSCDSSLSSCQITQKTFLRDSLLWEIQACIIECNLGTTNQNHLRISQGAIFQIIKFTGGK